MKYTSFLLAAATLVAASSAQAAVLTWDITAGDGVVITDGAGTWTTGAGKWNNAGVDANWSSTDSAIFTGTTGGAITVDAAGVTQAGVTVNGTANYTFSGGSIGGSGALTMSGSSILTLSGTNGYTGATVVTGGKLVIAGSTTGTSGLTLTGSTLTVDGTFGTTASWTINGIGATGTINGAASGIMSGTSLTVASSAATASTANFDAAGTLTLSSSLTIGTNLGSGALNQSAGVINAKGITIGSGFTSFNKTYTMTGGRLNLGTSGMALAVGSGSATANLGAGTLGATANWGTAGTGVINLTDSTTGTTFDTADSVTPATARTITLGLALSSTGKLVKAGIGTLKLTGDSTYSGGTIINAGILNAANAGGLRALGTGHVTIQGGTLAINDTAAGQVTLGAGATLAMTSGIIAMDIISGSSFDKILGNGTAHFTLGGGNLVLAGFAGFEGTGVSGSSYTLLSGFSATGNSTTGLSISGYDTTKWIASLNAGTGILSFAAVPEPSTYGLISAGAVAAVAVVRRRRKVAGKAA